MPAGLSCPDRLRHVSRGLVHGSADRIKFTWRPFTVPPVTDWRFSFHCLPPCVATTQLRFDTSRLLTARKGTFTPLSVCLLRRTGGDVLVALSLSPPHGDEDIASPLPCSKGGGRMEAPRPLLRSLQRWFEFPDGGSVGVAQHEDGELLDAVEGVGSEHRVIETGAFARHTAATP